MHWHALSKRVCCLTHTLKCLQVMAKKKKGRGATTPRITRIEKTKSSTWGGEKQGWPLRRLTWVREARTER